MSQTIYFLTSNEHKFMEAQEIFERQGIKLKWLRGRYAEVQADSLEEVAAEALKSIKHKNVFIEDSGLFITALRGFPGVYSSYVHKTLGNEGILKLLRGEKNRSASFKSVAGFKGGRVKLFKGEVKGFISTKARGNQGFGYDPIFVPLGYRETFAENYKLKNEISHRKKALEKLVEYISESGGK